MGFFGHFDTLQEILLYLLPHDFEFRNNEPHINPDVGLVHYVEYLGDLIVFHQLLLRENWVLPL
jgi:hypothetical protein